MPTLRGLESFRAFGDEQWELYTITHATALRAAAHPTGGPDPEESAALMRAATGPETLRRYFEALRSQDVTPLLGRITMPTLVLEVRSTIGARTSGRAVVSAISRARLVEVGGTSAEWPSLEIANHITRFVLGRELRQPPPEAMGAPQSGTAVILFADIVDSTAITGQIGNAAFRDRSRQLEGALRAAIQREGGAAVEGRTLGDGVLGDFTSAAQAIAAAIACAEAAKACGLALHLGLHAGDVLRESGNVYGMAVNVASRISGLAAPDEILVSSTVRDLARASTSVTFEDGGEHALKGVADAQRVFKVRPEPQ